MTKTEDKDLKYVWLDLETTGSSASFDIILEIGMVITDANLEPLGTFSRVLHDDGTLAMADQVVRDMHAANGLDQLIGDGISLEQAEEEAIAFLKPFEKKHDFVLAGSGVSHFDRRFLDESMPRFVKWFRYYNIDVGVLRRSMKLIGREDLLMPFSQQQKTHRALDDARLHLEEMRHLRRALS